MIKENITLTKLQADDGMVLTNGENYGKTVYLGINDKADNWREITEENYKSIQNEKEKLK